MPQISRLIRATRKWLFPWKTASRSIQRSPARSEIRASIGCAKQQPPAAHDIVQRLFVGPATAPSPVERLRPQSANLCYFDRLVGRLNPMTHEPRAPNARCPETDNLRHRG